MGTKMAPAYANLFMGELEPKLIKLNSKAILIWKRFIDDIFIVWTDTESALDTFIENINKVHHTIKFTHEQSTEELTFLDTTVYKGPKFHETGLLDVKTNIKPTNKQLYVHKTSYHPESCKNAITTGETQRYLTTNTQEQTFKEMTHKLTNKLIERGYKAKQIKQSLKKFPFCSRNTILNKEKQKQEQPPTVIPVKYNDSCNEIREIVNKHWDKVQEDTQLKNLFPNKPMLAYKKNQSLANNLVRSKIKTPIQMINETPRSHRTDPPPAVTKNFDSLFPKGIPIKKCNKRTCKLCHRMRIGKTIYNRKCHLNVLIPKYKYQLTCWSSRVVYAIKCNKCHETYVGQTVNRLRDRIQRHITAITSEPTRHMSHHFNKSCNIENLQFIPLEKVDDRMSKRDAEQELKRIETLWIRKLSTMQPWGMNYLEVDITVRTKE